MKIRRIVSVAQLVLGFALLLLGVLAFGHEDDMTLPVALSFGLGAALVALGISGFILTLSLRPQDLDTEDKKSSQRSLRVREKSGYITLRIMRSVILVFIVVLFFLKTSTAIILCLIGIEALSFIVQAVFTVYYGKKLENEELKDLLKEKEEPDRPSAA